MLGFGGLGLVFSSLVLRLVAGTITIVGWFVGFNGG